MYLVLDIETLERPMPPRVLDDALKAIVLKNQELYKKPETIQAHIEEDSRIFGEKWKFSRAGAQILCVGIGAFEDSGKQVASICFPNDSEAEVLSQTWAALADITLKELPVYTYNGDSFDWPILIRACAEHGRYPAARFGRTTDLIKYPYERFQSNVTLDALYALYKGNHEIPERLNTPGFENPTGADVAAMWAADKDPSLDGNHRVRNYCLQDVSKTGRIAQVVRSIFN